MPTEWTPERRQQQSDAIKRRNAEKRSDALAAPPPPPMPDPPTDDPNPAVNPDLVRSEPSAPRPARAARIAPTTKPMDTVPYDVALLIADLSTLPLESIPYVSCGDLINACSAAITALSTARRLKQESLEAGTHKAPCSTCGRTIDISKPGGFQILTVRDEHFQPKNVYFCSQNCLLARNMPSHAKAERERLDRERKAK